LRDCGAAFFAWHPNADRVAQFKEHPVRRFQFGGRILLFATALYLCVSSAAAEAVAGTIVNGQALGKQQIEQLRDQYGIQAQPGRYWYDRRSGAFGLQGGSTLGLLPAGLIIGGALKASASGGGDGRYGGVFVNGRELHPQDVAGLKQQLGQVKSGRYWVDAQGNFGLEGGALLGNLYALAAQRGSSGPRGSRPAGCYGEPTCETGKSWLGENYFSDGKTGCIVMDGEISC